MNEIATILREWTFKACDEYKWMPAKVPGCVHTDLLHNGVISNPFYGINESGLQWIDKKDWEYVCMFDIPEELKASSRLELVFDGLDTYADVYLNGRHIVSADNMFRSWRIEVKRWLTDNGNRLAVRFRSPVHEDLPKLQKLGYALPATNDQSDVGGLGDNKISVFARKAPYHYGWDWGPRFVTSGIWREVRLEGWSACRIRDLFIRQDQVTPSFAKLTAVLEIESEEAWEGTLRMATEGLSWSKDVSLGIGSNLIELNLEIDQPRLWWCRGLGDQHLYTFKAELLAENKTEAAKTVRTGLRSIKLVTDADADGTSFNIELNGVAVFAKGANHIPNDSFLTEVTYETYRHEIATAAASNMNMLRVWGGGIYEEDVFYQLCDEYGLLVWQDFMFACSMYPGDEAFLQNIELEAAENVKRLRNYPCIALWCGNNEIDTAWSHYDEQAGWGWKQLYSTEQRERIWNDYEQIFHHILPEAVTQYAPGVSYWPSSPMCSLTGRKDQHAHNNSTSGDIHYWGVWHSVEPFEKYNVHVGRFMSEYGFQSFPEYKSVRTYAEESEMALESEVMLAHQKNNRGNQLIKQYMDIYMNEPKDFPSFLYVSQVLQAEAMKTAIEAHRRRKPFCMGSLYWQMNDCWPVASWSGMDYYGRWKALQYYARRSFSDILLSVDGTDDSRIDVYIVSDITVPFRGTLKVILLDFSGKVLQSFVRPIEAEGLAGIKAFSMDAEELLKGLNRSSVVLVAELEKGGVVTQSCEHYFVPFKQMQLDYPTIRISEVEGSAGTSFILETDTLAKQVRLSAETEGIFDDNYFDLLPNKPRTVTFMARSIGEIPFIPAAPGEMKVHSMIDFVTNSNIGNLKNSMA
ncbi:beta-mannosidase [Paenibacillus sedimenti]|uniref:Beta-mannosidase B n=1 Tax=Paenibacillus sedimenti TaxID=2770274 RepID=A0A926QMQ4_9BACL|nr:glycoside hydrolase family 2 protein [Paenibacillus sedimenti]MBD0383604.1 glycoside hydrolase family 2 protein [Paenibacillus sedimenti]